jgi:hypothetical protein
MSVVGTSSSRAERLPAALAVSAVVIATLLLFAPLLLGAVSGHPRFFEWDVPEQYWGDLVYLCRSLHDGVLPYWNPYDRGGYPYYADPQAAAYHPLAWGICAIAGSSPGLAWQESRVVLGFLCAGLFGLLWLRRLGASWAASGLGAVIVECAPFMRHNWELNLTSALGWLPMVLWALERALQLRRARDAALLALAQGLLVWSGSPPAAWFAGTFTALYATGRLLEVARREGRTAFGPALLTLGLATLLVGGLCAVVLAPGLTLAKYSVQAGRSYESLAEGGLALRDATALFWPRDGNHLYVGWLALTLASLAWLRRPRLPGLGVLYLAVLVSVLLALGDHGPLFRLAFDLVPGVRLFRLPHRYEAWLGPAFGALAAAGFDGSLRLLREKLPRLRASWVVSVAAIVLPLLVVLDVSRRLPPERHTRPRPAPAGEEVTAHVLPRAPYTAVSYRYLDEFGISCRSGTRLARRDFRGYQDPLLLHAYERVLAALREHPTLAMQFNVRYALTGPHFIHGWNRHYLPPPSALRALPGARDRGEGVIEFTRALPLAYVVPLESVEHVSSREEALARTIAEAPAPLAILEDATTPRSDHARASLSPARVLSYGTDALTLEATATTAGVLVVNETWYPGWRAWVDGRETPVLRVNGLVRALALGAGRHRVALRFLPADGPPLRWLLLASWLTVLGLLFGPIVVARLRARREALRT